MDEKGPLSMVKVVFDTNMLISAWFWKSSESRLIGLAEEGKLDGYTSPQLLNELKKALEYPKFKLQQHEVETIHDYYALVLKVVEPRHSANVIAEDPEDNRVLECAIQMKAGYISENRHLLAFKQFKGMGILRAKEPPNALANSDNRLPF